LLEPAEQEGADAIAELMRWYGRAVVDVNERFKHKEEA
jgi:hypothetical protein